jgi:hypothetical protein
VKFLVARKSTELRDFVINTIQLYGGRVQSDLQLKRVYNQYNKKYFNNELSDKVELVWEPTPKCDGVTCAVWEISDGIFSIKIDPALKGEPCWWRLVLLHEMCHVKLWRQHPKHEHGKVFEAEKDRLYALGALKKLW